MVPSEDGELVQSSNQVPTCGDVASDEDAERKDGEGVHESRPARRRACHGEASIDGWTYGYVDSDYREAVDSFAGGWILGSGQSSCLRSSADFFFFFFFFF